MQLVLSRVKEEDLDELLLAQYSSFAGNPAHDAIYGPNTAVARADAKKKFLNDMRTDPADCWLKIVDQDTGRIAAASNWKIYPTWVERTEGKAEEKGESNGVHAVFGFEPGSDEMEAHEVTMKDYLGRRRRYTDGEAHVVLDILFVIPEYQRHGCGTLMVRWGTDLADRLFVPAWVEGSPAGKHLYETHGFKELEYVATKTKKWTVIYHMMKRDPCHATRLGGLAEFGGES